jgi:hypothetical protein
VLCLFPPPLWGRGREGGAFVPDAPAIAIILSAAALAVSLVTMWVTLFRRGALKMTQPTTVMFGPDGRNHEGDPKIYLRALLYSTAKRGHVIENMFVRLSRGEHRQSFPIWVLGNERLFRGSGIFVGDQGVVADHHFLLPPDAEQYLFKVGEYRLDVFARTVGASEPQALWSSSLIVSENDRQLLAQPHNAIYFDWGPDSNRYISSIRSKPPAGMPKELVELFENGLPTSPKADDRRGV